MEMFMNGMLLVLGGFAALFVFGFVVGLLQMMFTKPKPKHTEYELRAAREYLKSRGKQ